MIFGNSLTCRMKEQEKLWDFMKLKTSIIQICKITINPKKYFEKFKDRKINKKHKGVRRDTVVMKVMLKEFLLWDSFIQSPKKKLIQKRLQVKNTNMIMASVNKVKVASVNDKRYYGSDGIVSLPFGHPLLNEVR